MVSPSRIQYRQTAAYPSTSPPADGAVAITPCASSLDRLALSGNNWALTLSVSWDDFSLYFERTSSGISYRASVPLSSMADTIAMMSLLLLRVSFRQVWPMNSPLVHGEYR